MRSPFDRIAEEVIREAVVEGWRVAVDELRYFPEGGGSYHWVAHRRGMARWFVTIDDLGTKPWLGADHDTVFDGLVANYGVAMELRAAGATFVVAPIPARSGAPALRIDGRHALSVLDVVDGVPGRWGHGFTTETLGQVIPMLVALHAAGAAAGVARRGLELPDRAQLEQALDDVDDPWDGGPLSEPARHALRAHREQVTAWLDELDRAAARLASSEVVVTHGEPHPGNLIRTSYGLALVDWDTVALARPERDLWMIAEADRGLLAAYEAATGRRIDDDALAAYRLLWALTDVASFVTLLRRRHERTVDNERALTGLQRIFAGVEPAPYG